MKKYDHKKVEKKWRTKWVKQNLYKVVEDTKKPKCYTLDMFPYPSGEGLHVGHPKGYIATDIYSRMKRMQGFNVLHPMGWDAFGLPAENYAIKNKVHPSKAVQKNVTRYKKQLSQLGFTFDWSREINTTDPTYYRWSQWIFLKLFEKGLAYQSFEPINWCPKDMTGLANEDVENGRCERCGTLVEKKPMRQWVLKITEYADRMLSDLELLNWENHVKEAQRNWIGRSEGAEIEFSLLGIFGQADGKHKVKVFTTRPDTLFGATFLAISPELAKKWLDIGWKANTSIQTFITKELKNRSDDKYAGDTEKRGIDSTLTAINPATKKLIPVWIVNYVLGDVGTGAIMAVPAHDERDHVFAIKFKLPIISVIEPVTGIPQQNPEFRKSIVAILRNKEGKLLSLNWGKNGGNLFIGGGREGEEDIVSCAKREIVEETGYTNIKFVSQTPTIHHQYFAYSKGVARNIDAIGILFDLVDDTKTSTKLEKDEVGKFTLEWVSEKDANDRIKDELHHTCYELLIKNPCYVGEGVLENSGTYNGLSNKEARWKITEDVGGKRMVLYKLKDWVFSRQRYWGEPIPLVHALDGKVYPVDESELPVELPKVKSYEPTGTGESPLAGISSWVNVHGYISEEGTFKLLFKGKKVPKGVDKDKVGTFRRETNTMPQWAGSSWYYLRFIDPKNKKTLVDKKKEAYWMNSNGVDLYVGGMEHATRHLIYARFWHKFLYDIGAVSTKEPFDRLQTVGLINASDGRKMSKRYGNVINPDDIVKIYGADTLRVYEMFMGPFSQAIAWSTDNMIGSRRFLERIWRLSQKVKKDARISKDIEVVFHQTIKKVGNDIKSFGFNTAIAQLMIFLNVLEKEVSVSPKMFADMLRLIAPFAPHITEELWEALGEKKSIHLASWPNYDETKLVNDTVQIAVQINGKLRDTILLAPEATESEALAIALVKPSIEKWVQGGVKKVIYIKGKILNLIV